MLLYPEGILQLNETAHAIVDRCDGLTSVTEIIAALGRIVTSPKTNWRVT